MLSGSLSIISSTLFMNVVPLRTPLLRQGDDIGSIIRDHGNLQSGDILVLSSKAVATVEGRAIRLERRGISAAAMDLSRASRQDPRFTQAILDETQRMQGEIVGVTPHAVLTSLHPRGMKRGRILCPNAGLDLSNVEDGHAIGWPEDPVQSVAKLWQVLRSYVGPSEQGQGEHAALSIIISDSCCHPGRLGVTAFALVCAGMRPFRDERGLPDLFGRELRMTQEALADQLATAANILMGNAAQSIPAAIIRGHNIPSSEYCGWVDGIEEGEDLFGIDNQQLTIENLTDC